MYKTFKTRIYPNKEQIQYFNECFGYYRFVYNWGLEKWKSLGGRFDKYEYGKNYNHTIGQNVNFDWIKNYNPSIKQEALLDLDTAIKNHYNYNYNGNMRFRSKRKTTNHFRMHKKKPKDFIVIGNHASIHTCMSIVNRLEFNMAETIKFNNDNIKTIAISERNSKYYIHIVYLIEPKYNHIHKKKLIGIDLGYKNPVVSYNGKRFKSDYCFPKERIMYLERKLSKYQQKMSGQQYGHYNDNGEWLLPSNRYEKTRIKFNKTYLKITNIRKDWREKLTTKLAKKYKTINIDIPDFKTTNIKEINQAMYRVGLYDFTQRLYDKVLFYNGNILEIPKGYKSTQTCSRCGHVFKKYHKLELKDRIYECPDCNNIMDRDENAAKNIYNFNRLIKVNVYRYRTVHVFRV